MLPAVGACAARQRRGGGGAGGRRCTEIVFCAGACYHALGYHKSAMEDYSKAFLISNDDLSEETRQQQVLLGQTLINLKGGLMAGLTNASGAFVVAEGKASVSADDM